MGDWPEVLALLAGVAGIAALHAKWLIPVVMTKAAEVFVTRKEFRTWRDEHDSRHDSEMR